MPDKLPPSLNSVYREEYIRPLKVPDNFFGLLDAIREKPGFYIGRISLSALYIWLEGFHFAREQAGLPEFEGYEDFAGFDGFVCRKYRWLDTGGWAAKIAYYHRDDASAFEEFFKLLDEYRARLLRRQDRKRQR